MGKKRKHDEFVFNEGLVITRNIIKRKLLPGSTIRGYDKEKTHLLDLVKRTVELGESNSVLIVGPRGCGKTTLLNGVLNEVRQEKVFYKKALVVQLHGLIHTDDRLALKDATRQMQLENVVGNKVFGSFAENLTYLLQCLKSGNKETSKSVIFVLEEFDLFCGHHNQTLLYNLFDVAQSAQAPICVVGLTCRLDVIELLEKRVKSRFSHRQIFLFPKNNFETRMKLLKKTLSLPNGEHDLDDVFVHCWNNQMAALCSDKEVKDVMSKLFNMDNSERTFKSFLMLVISKLSEEHDELTAADFVQQYELWSRDAKVTMLVGLSVLELCLSLEFIVPVSGTVNNLLKEYQLHKFLLTSEQVREAVKLYQGLPTEVEQWAASSYQ
ncbi:Origin recognition complex subunit 4 [Blattella germanica]|nr:Origin recognition complex subunit 4 [Blattella germanica]